MTLYEINKEILTCIDMDTGEILDEEKLHNLQMDRHEKRRGYVFTIMNLSAAAKAYREQEERFKHRRERTEKTVKRLLDLLKDDLGGEEMHEPEFTVSYRASQAVEITNINKVPAKFITFPEPKADKNAIKAALKAGETINGAVLMNKRNMVIK